ncbi:MAG: hypothetical protein KAU62_08010 [Candidatus Heimdallarchaeota archaeon]|nr:hypothetical protein [Candidatus Heimdallarchaeota archaeon]MCG3256015.1 hypothetical protein [Candidatus Heimdallarchaeota archaeon]MCK4611085.1 hypothetical protein [Candidatus Heimdallarchaeota archaeon]
MKGTKPISFSKEEAINALTSLGLTLGEAKTYTALVGIGPTYASTIARLAKVPQPKVYGHLENLIQRTFVTRQAKEGVPDTFTAVPYELVIESLEEEVTEKIKAATKYFEGVKDLQKTREVEDLFSYFEGDKAVFAGLKTVIGKIEKNVILIVTNTVHEKTLSELLKDRKKTNPKIKILHLDVKENVFMRAPPFKRLVKSDGFKGLMSNRPSILYVDVDFENMSCSSMNMILPQIDEFGTALINIKHPIALHFQIQLVSSLLESFETIGMSIKEL